MSGWFIFTIPFGIGIIGAIIALFKNEKNSKNSSCSARDYYDTLTMGIILAIIAGFGFITFICIGFGSIISANREKQLFIEKREMIEQVIENNNNYDNYGISNAIVECNEWLSKVKVSKQTDGIFSWYYYLDVSDLEYLN